MPGLKFLPRPSKKRSAICGDPIGPPRRPRPTGEKNFRICLPTGWAPRLCNHRRRSLSDAGLRSIRVSFVKGAADWLLENDPQKGKSSFSTGPITMPKECTSVVKSIPPPREIRWSRSCLECKKGTGPGKARVQRQDMAKSIPRPWPSSLWRSSTTTYRFTKDKEGAYKS